MHEITRICDEVIFLDHGKIVAQDTPLNLTKRISSATIRLTLDNNKERLEQYLQAQKQHFSFLDNHTVIVSTQEKLIPEVLFGISRTGVDVTDIEIQKPTLQDVFLQIARKE
jgi:ABC-2 type transport system ATP-binding protein